jgi:hypothetical protein
MAGVVLMTAPLLPDQKEHRAEDRRDEFIDALILAGNSTGSGIRWQPFQVRKDVAAELARLGYELCEDGANHNPKLRRFFAMKKATP